jgi:glycerol-3-phosphate dehydrogenase (NAD(P)+)
MQKISIIGAGNYGFALTYHLDRQQNPDFDLYLYDHNPATINHITQTHQHPRFYPTIELSSRVQAISDLPPLLNSANVLILATVSTALESVLDQIKPLISSPLHIVSVMKALDDDTGQPLTKIIADRLAGLPVTIRVLAGGTTGAAFTSEQYLGATLASPDPATAELLASIFRSPYLQIQPSSDVIGIQYAGSYKNLISVIVGILSGLGFDYGTQTHALSLAATECATLALSFGAQPATFSFASQCWGNDMVMSATSSATRNHQLGLLLGQGLKFSTAVTKMKDQGKTAESVNTLAILPRLADLAPYPLLQFLTQLSQEQISAHQIIKVIETYPPPAIS